ncbi:hypothetical protein GCM10009738_84680 [Kitasatospora viridis]
MAAQCLVKAAREGRTQAATRPAHGRSTERVIREFGPPGTHPEGRGARTPCDGGGFDAGARQRGRGKAGAKGGNEGECERRAR